MGKILKIGDLLVIILKTKGLVKIRKASGEPGGFLITVSIVASGVKSIGAFMHFLLPSKRFCLLHLSHSTEIEGG
jgi:hypothetical protein